ILPAADPHAEFVILGAHYDSKLGCPGAVDNATGVALTIGVLQAIAGLENRQKNVLVVFFDQEEEELIGSQAFIKLLQKKQYAIHSVHTFDMAGWDEDQNGEVELGAPSPALQSLYEAHAQRLNIPTYVTRGGSTDYQSFLAAGFPVIGVNEAFSKGDYSPFKDTPKDTYDTVNFNYLRHLTQYVTEVITDLITAKNISYGTN
ncbi:MAG: Zn-dependent exopeptidase M28, partial [Saprospiraceae bacterium]|nr:Zn-dependent exopeptidase M28 [Saprospiraceae bacterium]